MCHKCTECGRSFKTKNGLTYHLRGHSGAEPFRCPECGKAYIYKQNLTNHLQVTHSDKKPFHCTECDGEFKTKSGLNSHCIVHTDVKPFNCTQCDRSFKTKSGLSTHFIVHSDKKPFKCIKCANTFKTKSGLSTHFIVHSVEKPFKCTKCANTFKTNFGLSSHLTSHADETQFQCPVCGMALKQKGHLTLHLKSHKVSELLATSGMDLGRLLTLCGISLKVSDRIPVITKESTGCSGDGDSSSIEEVIVEKTWFNPNKRKKNSKYLLSAMTNNSDEAASYCRTMCPERERIIRTVHKLIHPLEFEGQRMVKQFSRSAAGQVQNHPLDVRCPELCRKTAKYLAKHIIPPKIDKKKYDFVFDRLRAVRQDLVIMQSKFDVTGALMDVLEISVRFHLLANFRLCHLTDSTFDARLNFSHLLECLKGVLCSYDKLDYSPLQRDEMSATYLILNLGSTEASRWAVDVDDSLKCQHNTSLAHQATFAYQERNYARLFKLMKKMDVVPRLAFYCVWPAVIRESLEVMNVAYSSKACRFPMTVYSRLFAFSSDPESDLYGVEMVKSLCSQFAINTMGEHILFLKATPLKDSKLVLRPSGSLFDFEMDDDCTLFKNDDTGSGEKPFQCEECDTGFSSRDSLTDHQILHSVDKWFCRFVPEPN